MVLGKRLQVLQQNVMSQTDKEEVVSLFLSSHSLLSTSTSLDNTGGGAATGTGNGGGDVPFATALNSAYFLCSPTTSSTSSTKTEAQL
jgi:hypothetical protein